MEVSAKKRFIINAIFLGLWLLIILITCRVLLKYILPFVIACVVAAVMQKPAYIISKATKLKKGLCAVILSAFLYILLAILLIFIVFKVFSFTGNMANSLSSISPAITDVLHRIEIVLERILGNISPELKTALNKIIYGMLDSIVLKVSTFLSETATFIVKTAPVFLFNSVVALAASCYIAKDFDGLVSFVKSFMTQKTSDSAVKIKNIFKDSVLKILGGYLVLMVITFCELSVGFLILGVKNWLLIAVIIAVFDALPILGVGAFLLPWGIGSIILGNFYLGLGLLVLYLILAIVRNFAESKIVGSKTGINPLFILFTMFLGLKLFGFLGLIILPVTFIVVVKYYKNEMEQNSSP